MQSHLLINKQHIHNIFFAPTQVNKILNNSKYTKLLYSTNLITLNGLLFHIQLNNFRHYKLFNKYHISFDNIPPELYNIMSLEKALLHKKFPTKLPAYNIFNIIQHKQLNFYSNTTIPNPGSLILKISGIWSNETECGLTFRIYPSVITK
jgi:hypothetical protein